MLKKMNALQSLGPVSQRSIRFVPRSGQPLPEDVRHHAERLMGEDFSDVHVFVTTEALRMNVRAFTSGSNIYIAPGEYVPNTGQGWRLLGHELAHVVQQRKGMVRNPYGYGVAVMNIPELERQAERMGMVLQQARFDEHQCAENGRATIFQAMDQVYNAHLPHERRNVVSDEHGIYGRAKFDIHDKDDYGDCPECKEYTNTDTKTSTHLVCGTEDTSRIARDLFSALKKNVEQASKSKTEDEFKEYCNKKECRRYVIGVAELERKDGKKIFMITTSGTSRPAALNQAWNDCRKSNFRFDEYLEMKYKNNGDGNGPPSHQARALAWHTGDGKIHEITVNAVRDRQGGTGNAPLVCAAPKLIQHVLTVSEKNPNDSNDSLILNGLTEIWIPEWTNDLKAIEGETPSIANPCSTCLDNLPRMLCGLSVAKNRTKAAWAKWRQEEEKKKQEFEEQKMAEEEQKKGNKYKIRREKLNTLGSQAEVVYKDAIASDSRGEKAMSDWNDERWEECFELVKLLVEEEREYYACLCDENRAESLNDKIGKFLNLKESSIEDMQSLREEIKRLLTNATDEAN